MESFNQTFLQHQGQLAQIQTFLYTSFNFSQSSWKNVSSKLDSLTDTTVQLFFDHQQIQGNISDVECLDTEQSLELHQNLQNHLTHQLENINNDVTYLKIIHPSHTCGGTEGWRRAVYLDVTDPNTTCPSGWQLTGYSKRTCGRNKTGTTACDSATFPVTGGPYSSVCGRIRAYQWGGTDAFSSYQHGQATTIDTPYVESVSVTHGTPRRHI